MSMKEVTENNMPMSINGELLETGILLPNIAATDSQFVHPYFSTQDDKSDPSFFSLIEQTIVPYEAIFTAFEQAFNQYVVEDQRLYQNSIDEVISSFGKLVFADAGPNFVNITFEDLFKFPTTEGSSDAIGIADGGNTAIVDSIRDAYTPQYVQVSIETGEVTSVSREVGFDSPRDYIVDRILVSLTENSEISSPFYAPTALEIRMGSVYEGFLPIGSVPNPTLLNVMGNLFSSGVSYGPNGRSTEGILALSFANASNTTGVGEGTSSSPYIIQASDGFASSNTGNIAIRATDSLGNSLTIDQVTGDYVYTFNQAFNDSVPGTAVTEIFDYQLKDGLGHVSGSTLSVTVVDDAPVANAIASGSMSEANLATGTSPNASILKLSGNLFASGTLYGADGPSVKGVSVLSFASVTNSSGVGGGSSSADYTIGIADGFVAGDTGHSAIKATDSLGNSIIIDEVTGDYVYTLSKAFSNIVSGTAVSESFTYQLRDSDGSVASNTLTVSVSDDAPVAKAIAIGSLTENDLPIGSSPNASALKLSGNLYTSGTLYGADGSAAKGISALSFASTSNASGVSAGSSSATYTIVSGDGFVVGSTGHSAIKATDSLGNSIIVDEVNGDYVYTLSKAFSNIVSGTVVSESFTYQLQDSDGSVDSNTLTVTVSDDAPIAKAIAMGSLAEDDLPIGSSPNASALKLSGNLYTSGSLYSADGAAIKGISALSFASASNASGVSAGSSSVTYTIVSGDGFVVGSTGHSAIKATDSLGNSIIVDEVNGDYVYTLSKAFSNIVSGTVVSESFTYQLQDSDGSVASNTLSVSVGDDAPVAKAIVMGSLAEDDLATGSSPNSSALRLSGNLFTSGALYGADGTATKGISALSFASITNASGVSAGSSSATYTIVAGDGFAGANTGHAAIKATDSLGNSIIIDEVTGDYVYTLSKAFTNTVSGTTASESFTYQLKDSDGSVSSNTLTVTILDDAPVAAVIAMGSVMEADLGAGSSPNSGALKLSGNLFTSGALYGADGGATKGISNLSFASASNTSGIIAGSSSATYTIVAGDGFAGANTGHSAIKATDSLGNSIIVDEVTGDYVYNLSKAFSNTLSGSPVSEIFTYQIQDSDGSVASSTLAVSIADDAPLAVAISMGSVMEADLPSGSSPNSGALKLSGNLFTSGALYGADGGAAKGILTLSFASVTNTSGVSAGSSSLDYTIVSGDGFKAGSTGHSAIKATDSLGNSIIIDQVNGDYVYTLNDDFINTIPSTSVTESFTYQLRDSDGSVASNTLSVTVVDDAPFAIAIAMGSATEADLPAGSSPDPSALFVSGNVFASGASYGSSGPAAGKGITALSFSSITNTSGVTGATSSTDYIIVNGDGFAAGNIGHSAIKATDSLGNSIIIDQVNGDFVYTLGQRFSNTVAGTAVSEIFNYQLTDSAGVTASNTLSVSVADDAPVAQAIDLGIVSETDLPVGSSPTASALKLSGNIYTSGNIYGADGAAAKGISGLLFASATNATGVSAGSSSVAYTITGSDGFDVGDIGHSAIKATDNLGNSIIIDEVTGDYVYTLAQSFSNKVSGIAVSESFTYQLKDSDGSVDNSTLSVLVADDTPVAKAIAMGSVSESDLPTGSLPTASALKLSGNLFTSGVLYGADGGAAKGISALSFASVTNASGVSTGSSSATYTIVAGDGFAGANTGHTAIKATDSLGNSIIIDEVTGDYVYTLSKAFTNTVSGTTASESFTYQLKDSDGSVANSTLSVLVADDTPVAKAIAMGSVSEADLPAGSSPTSNALKLSGNLLTSGALYGADGGAIKGITVLSFASASNTSGVGAGSSSVAYTIVKADGFASGNTGHSAIKATDSLGNSIIVDEVTGDYVYNLSKAFSNTLSGSPVSEIFTYQIQDSDGSVASSTLTLSIADDAPLAAAISMGSVMEADLPSGSSPNSGALKLSGNLFTSGALYGADGGAAKGILTLSFASVTNTSGVSAGSSSLDYTIVSGDGFKAGSTGHSAIKATDSLGNSIIIDEVNGDYVYTLNDAFNNTTSGSSVSEIFNYQLQDSDGSVASNTLSVSIVDGVPLAKAIGMGSLAETSLPTGSSPDPFALKVTGNLFTNGDTYGGDGAAVKGISALSFASATNTSGVSAGSSSAAYTITGTDGFGVGNTGHSAIKATDSLGNSLIVDEVTGDYVYTLNGAFHNTIADSPVTENFSYSLQDSDGSIATNTLSVNIADDAPIALSISIGPLSEASLPSGTLPSAALTYGIGNLVTAGDTFGADGKATLGASFLTWASATNATGVSAGVASSTPYIITPTDGFSAANVGHNAIKATDNLGNSLIIDEVTNDYVYHLQAGFTRIDSLNPVIESYSYQLTDSDGSTSTNTINVTIVPDTFDAAANNNIYLLDNAPTGFNTIYQVSSMTGGVANLTLIDSIANSISGPHGDVTLDGTKIYMLGQHFGYYDLTTSTFTQLPDLTYNGSTVTGMTQAGFAPDGQFYVGGGAGGQDFYTVNLSTGVLTNVGSATIAGTSNILNLIGGDLTITDDGQFYENSNIAGTTSVYLLAHIPDGTPNTATLVYSGGTKTSGLSNLSNGYLLLSDHQATNVFELVDSNGNLVSTYAYEYLGAPFSHSGGDLASNTITVLPGNNTIPTGGFTPTAGNEILTLTLNYPMGSSLPVTNSTVNETVSAANGLLGTLLTNSQPGDTYAIYSVLSYDTNPTPTLTNNIVIGITETIGIVDSSGQLAGEGNLIVNADGSFTFTPTIMTELSGNAFIDFTIQDTTSGQISNTGIVQIQNLVQIAPVVFDLSGSGIHLSSADASGVGVDLAGTGTFNSIGWIMNGEGVLAIDPNGTGKVTNVNQFSFASPSTGAETDLQGLVIYDTNHDGKLDVGDAAFSQFGLLLANGQFESLAKLGITSLSLTSDNQSQIINGNVVHGLTTFTTSDGQSHTAADVSLSISSHTSTPTTLQETYTTSGQLDLSKLPEHVTLDSTSSGTEMALEPADVIQVHNQIDIPATTPILSGTVVANSPVVVDQVTQVTDSTVVQTAVPSVSDVVGIMTSVEADHLTQQIVNPEHQNITGSMG